MPKDAEACRHHSRTAGCRGGRERIAKEEARLDGEIARIDKKLGNPAFVAKAPEEIVVAEQEKRAELVELRDKVMEARKRLADLSHA